MGLTPNVVADTPITSAWGNQIRDRSVQVFTSIAERSSQWTAPPAGAMSWIAGTLSVYNGSVWVCITPAAAGVATSVVDGRTTFGDLTGSPGPAVTIQTGVSALVSLAVSAFPGAQFARATMSFAISGATTRAASFANAVSIEAPNAGGGDRAGAEVLVTGLTPGVHTFTSQYMLAGGGGCTWSDRLISVVGLP